jgi:hypothetical protein
MVNARRFALTPFTVHERQHHKRRPSMALQIYDPTTEVSPRRINYAPRPKSLEGLRIGLVDNTKHNSNELLLRIAGLLERDYGAKAHVIRRKKSAGSAPHAEIVDELKANCDEIVAGVGD